jgi:methionyl-tRNA formyltransferase
MRILYLGNNRVGYRILSWLKSRQESIVGLIVHPAEKRKYGQEIIGAAGLGDELVFLGTQLGDTATLHQIRELEADLALSVFFSYVLKPDFLGLFPAGCINLHPSYLPFNRGTFPNVWSIVDGTPAGATLHYVDMGIDTGDVIARREVAVLPSDTGKTLYERLEQACVELFMDTWPTILDGTAPRIPQDTARGTHHRFRDVEAIDRIDLERPYLARELIDILRARTYPPYRGAYFVSGTKRFYVQIEILEEDEGPEE